MPPWSLPTRKNINPTPSSRREGAAAKCAVSKNGCRARLRSSRPHSDAALFPERRQSPRRGAPRVVVEREIRRLESPRGRFGRSESSPRGVSRTVGVRRASRAWRFPALGWSRDVLRPFSSSFTSAALRRAARERLVRRVDRRALEIRHHPRDVLVRAAEHRVEDVVGDAQARDRARRRTRGTRSPPPRPRLAGHAHDPPLPGHHHHAVEQPSLSLPGLVDGSPTVTPIFRARSGCPPPSTRFVLSSPVGGLVQEHQPGRRQERVAMDTRGFSPPLDRA